MEFLHGYDMKLVEYGVGLVYFALFSMFWRFTMSK